jgi:alpha/beta superfamily hydrolase
VNTQRVERVDRRENGGRLIAEFSERTTGTIFTVRHAPRTVPSIGVVVCPGLHGEFVRNQRREVALGRSLSHLGIAVQRFHYRGTGHSADIERLTFRSMSEDAISAAELLVASERCASVAFLGTRWGAFVAAVAATTLERPSVLWEPPVTAESYFRDVFRLARIQDLRQSDADERSTTRLEQLESDGIADVLGYALPASVLESSRAISLEGLLETGSSPMLIVGISPTGSLQPEVSRLARSRDNVDTHVIRMRREPWWFAGGRDPKEEDALTAQLIQVTAEWISRVHARGMVG